MLHSNSAEITKPVPEPVRKLTELIEAEGHGGPMWLVTISEPLWPDGARHVDFSTKAGRVIVQFLEGKFGVDDWEIPGLTPKEELPRYGEGPKYALDTPEETVVQIHKSIVEQVSRFGGSLTTLD